MGAGFGLGLEVGLDDCDAALCFFGCSEVDLVDVFLESGLSRLQLFSFPVALAISFY